MTPPFLQKMEDPFFRMNCDFQILWESGRDKMMNIV